MRTFYILSLLSLWNLCSAQNKKTAYDIDLKCYTLGQQQPLNSCLAEVSQKLEQQLSKKYNCILHYLERQLQDCTTKKCEELDYYKQHVKNFIDSQTAWKKLREKDAAFWSDGGGSITNQYIAESIIKDCKDRLKWLDTVIEEAGQGNETEVLKCQ